MVFIIQRDFYGSEDEILAQYANLVKVIARKYFLRGGDYDDLMQEGMIGLLKAMRHFDDSKSDDFTAYAGMCIKRRMFDAIRKSTRRDGNLQVVELPKDGSTGYDTFLTPDPETQFLANESEKEIREKLLQLLSPFEASVANLYLMGLGTEDIAKELFTECKSVNNAVTRIRNKALKNLQNGRLQE